MSELVRKLKKKRFRDSYVDANVRMFLAQQMRSLRGDMSQKEFGDLLGIPQSVVSRYEDPAYGKFNLQTLLEIAAKLDRAVVARIVDFQTFLRFTEDMSEHAMCPAGYDENELEAFATGDEAQELEAESSVRTRDALPFNKESGELARNWRFSWSREPVAGSSETHEEDGNAAAVARSGVRNRFGRRSTSSGTDGSRYQ